LSPEILTLLVDNKVGHFIVDTKKVVEHKTAQDLSIQINWPDIGKFSTRLKQLLGPPKEKFNRGDWKEAFEECCEIFESCARAHLVSGIKSGRIILLDRQNKPKILTAQSIKSINKAPIGTLKKFYSEIRNKNKKDDIIEKVLEQINPDRVEYVHRRRHKRTDASLRKNAGRHIWTVVMALKEIE
jgi:hypothetical protein